MPRAFIAIGSNLQQPRIQVNRAFELLASLPQTRLVKRSSLYRTAPIGYDNQPDFINAVAEIETELEPQQLLKELLALESQQGRERPFPNAPRVLDLDLLLYNNTMMQTSELTLPHPRMHVRGFVMLPLAEIAPDIEILGQGKATALAAQCQGQGVEKLAN
ncbi:MAG TPA: 2-amino-4-hydroxy-6-hydroxymethyldihydropteridine diphosphokinase [Methylophilaceae bacterium]|nr:2-amino-4-hydroxy-6-hydroxymethyldihydropteridine diphosphokinase [Methylophilaceae bacterium]